MGVVLLLQLPVQFHGPLSQPVIFLLLPLGPEHFRGIITDHSVIRMFPEQFFHHGRGFLPPALLHLQTGPAYFHDGMPDAQSVGALQLFKSLL